MKTTFADGAGRISPTESRPLLTRGTALRCGTPTGERPDLDGGRLGFDGAEAGERKSGTLPASRSTRRTEKAVVQAPLLCEVKFSLTFI